MYKLFPTHCFTPKASTHMLISPFKLNRHYYTVDASSSIIYYYYPEKMNNLNVLLTSAIGWERFLFLKLAFYPSEFKFITGAVRGRGKTDNMH